MPNESALLGDELRVDTAARHQCMGNSVQSSRTCSLIAVSNV
jgi:hypothetical protein